MSSAAAKAEARRKAILSKGSDRLAKLTTSARGEDAPAYLDKPLFSTGVNARNFVGEETTMPTPPARPSPSPGPPSPGPNSNSTSGLDGSVWSEDQQRQLFQALMGGGGGQDFPRGMSPQPGADGAAPELPPELADNPLAAMLFNAMNGGTMPPLPPNALGKPPATGPIPQAQTQTQVAKPKTAFQKLMPLVHLVAIWMLLAYFVFFKEPEAQGELSLLESRDGLSSVWRRWAELAYRDPKANVDSLAAKDWTVAAVPFFWAFMSLQIALHSTRIFKGFDAPRLPTLLAMALPHIPPPFPSIIVNGLKYLQMGSILLDDLAILAVGTGLIIWVAGLFSGSS
ncbi:hypothetical protein VNI00_009078 [Paramarasmius palmivorus]|uniref:Golgi to ER traffic protein 2 n=1 Tax=Paramarasmius palmivorus TaxID=297713 RepID=A0AAW0CP50_9AGAR